MSSTAKSERITADWIAKLADLLDSADLDSAVAYISDVQPEALDQNLDSLPLTLALRARCLICEVYDYAGRRKEASLCIARLDEEPREELEKAKREWAKNGDNDDSRENLEDLKLWCWACLHLGMVAHYRQHEYDEAFKLFELARDVLLLIHEKGIPSMGSLARAYYCMGLAERERYNLYDARRCFSESVECAWTRIVEKEKRGQKIAFLQYSLGRAIGLGMAWIAYARASMAEANSHIVAARLLLQEAGGVKYLRSYVDVVHACTQRSRATSLEKIDKAINDMTAAYNTLGGNAILQQKQVVGHFVYAQRAAFELAVAHLSAGRLNGEDRDEKKRAKADEYLDQALKYLELVENSLSHNDSEKKDTRTRCNVSIARSRVYLEMNNLRKAFEEAQRATKIGEGNPFSRIDCWTTLGDVYYHSGEIEKALEQFRKARNDTRAQTNPKVLAVCDLQIALCHLQLKQVRVAEEIFARWKSHGSQGRANGYVQHLVKQITEQLSEAAFVIPGDIPDDRLNLKENPWIEEAQKWLAQLAFKRAPGKNEKDKKQGAAELLGVDEKTLKKYLNFKGIDGNTDDSQNPD